MIHAVIVTSARGTYKVTFENWPKGTPAVVQEIKNA